MSLIQENVDFLQFYRNNLLKQLKENMELGIYPPRFRIDVKVNNRSFFSTPKCLKFVLMERNRNFQKNIAVVSAL